MMSSNEYRDGSGSNCEGFYFFEYFLVFGESSNFLFVPNLRAVDVYVKHTARTLDHVEIGAELIFNCVRQTDGLGCIISLYTVFDADFHTAIPFVYCESLSRCYSRWFDSHTFCFFFGKSHRHGYR